MGCDIHMFVENKRTINEKTQWVNADNWRINQYFEDGTDDGEQEYEVVPLYRERDYSVFAALAGVRDYSEGTPSLGAPKGMPEDPSKPTLKECEGWDSDGHSHSYFTLRELKEFQQHNGKIKHSGLVDPESAKLLDEKGILPKSWCQGTTQKEFVHRAWEEECQVLEPIISELDKRMRDDFYIWDKDDHPEIEEKVRIVFWFDN